MCYTLDNNAFLRYVSHNMSYLLVTGIVFIVIPIILIQGFAFFILLNFVRDDSDANNMFRLALGMLGFGVVLTVAYFVLLVIV